MQQASDTSRGCAIGFHLGSKTLGKFLGKMLCLKYADCDDVLPDRTDVQRIKPLLLKVIWRLTAVEQFISCSAWRVNMMSMALASLGLGR